MRRLPFLFAALLTGLAARPAGGVPPAPGDAAPDEQQVLVYNTGAEPETLDPALMTGVPEHTIALALFEGLVTLDGRTLEPRPGVAASWEVTPDGRVYTFHLREAVWSNGDPLTAEDFVWSWRRVLTPATASQYAYQLYAVRNARAFNAGSVTDPQTLGVEAPDARTLRVTLERPTPYFLELCAFETLMPVHRPTVEAHGTAWTRPEHIVSNGPFVLREWAMSSHITCERNPLYWDRERVYLRQIRFLPVDDQNTALNMFLNREVHWITSVPVTRVNEVLDRPEYVVEPYLGSYFYRLNVTRPPFDDARVRRAFDLAIDKEDLVTNVLQGIGYEAARGFVPRSIGDFCRYPGYAGPDFDPVEARALLAQAGYPEGRGFPSVELLFNTNETHRQIAEAVCRMWRENLGVTVALRNTEWKVYLETVDRMDYQIARAGWIGDYVDPNTFLDMFVTGGGNNNTGWSNAEYDRLIALAAETVDPTERFATFRRAEEILVGEELPIIPLYYYVNQEMISRRVRGVYPNIRALHPFQGIYIARQ